MPNEERKLKYFQLVQHLNKAYRLMQELEETSVVGEGDDQIEMEYPCSAYIDLSNAHEYCEGVTPANVRVLIHTPAGGVDTVTTNAGKRKNRTTYPFVKYEVIDGVAVYSLEEKL